MNAIAVFDPSSSYNSGHIKGYVGFHQCDNLTHSIVRVFLSGFAPNSTHAIHIHECGDLSQGCDSACAHYNPHNKKHGSLQHHGEDRHIGDLAVSNLVANENGIVNIAFIDDLIDLFGNYSIIGRSVVIHDKEDDMGIHRDENDERGKESGKTGNAGSRIGCSVIGITNRDFHKH